MILTGIGLLVIPLSKALACAISLGKKRLYGIITNKYNKYKEQYERDQQTIKYFDDLYRNASQENVIDKSEYESLCKIFTKYVDETKIEPFLDI